MSRRDPVSEVQYRRLDRLAEEDEDAKVVGIEILSPEFATLLVRRGDGSERSVLPNGRIGNRPLRGSTRQCPECGKRGKGLFCHHWDAAGERKIPTVPVDGP